MVEPTPAARTVGFGPVRDPGNDPKLRAINRAAAEDLLRFYGLTWVPGEYWALLEQDPDPVVVFRHFCFLFGLDVEEIRARQQAELDVLQQVVSILLELGLIRDKLPKGNREQILEAMKQGLHARAEELLSIVQTMILAMEDAQTLAAVGFANCKIFVGELDNCKDDLLQVTLEDAQQALQATQDYKEAWEKYLYLARVLDELVAWVEQYWPGGSQWATDNEPVVNGMVVVKETTMEALLQDSSADVFGGIETLEQIHRDFLVVMEEIKLAHGTGPGPQQQQGPYRGTYQERVAQWQWALEFFQFPEDVTPTEEEVRAKYRPLAKQHHPDKFPPDKFAPAVVQEHQRQFEDANRANEILKRGKPQR